MAGLRGPWWGPYRLQARRISLPDGHRLPRAPSSQHCPQSPSIFPCRALLARRPCGRQVWGSQPSGEAPVGEDLLRGHPGPGAQAHVRLPTGVGSQAGNQQPLPSPRCQAPGSTAAPSPGEPSSGGRTHSSERHPGSGLFNMHRGRDSPGEPAKSEHLYVSVETNLLLL